MSLRQSKRSLRIVRREDVFEMKSLVFYKEKLYCFLQERLKKNPKIHYLQRAWRYRNDEGFVYQVMNINHNPDVMEIKRFGEKNRE